MHNVAKSPERCGPIRLPIRSCRGDLKCAPVETGQSAPETFAGVIQREVISATYVFYGTSCRLDEWVHNSGRPHWRRVEYCVTTAHRRGSVEWQIPVRVEEVVAEPVNVDVRVVIRLHLFSNKSRVLHTRETVPVIFANRASH